MGEALRPGDKIPLALQLSDDDTSLFPLVTLKDASGADLPSSPISLVHISTGFYANSDVSFPVTDRVFAIYRTYNDALHNTRSKKHTQTLAEVFPRDFVHEKIDNLLASSLPGEQLSGTLIDSGLLLGFIDDSSNGLLGFIDDDNELVGTIFDPDTVSGILESGGELLGTIDC